LGCQQRQDHDGGTDIRSITPEDLLARISIVFQDVYLFGDTVYTTTSVSAAKGQRKKM
jgi:ATP-binding cassette subfamily B protein